MSIVANQHRAEAVLIEDETQGVFNGYDVGLQKGDGFPFPIVADDTDPRYQYIGSMTDEEKNRYFYLVGTEGYEAADKYLNFLTDGTYGILTVRNSMELQEQLHDMAASNGWMGALMTLASFGTNLVSGTGTVYSVWQQLMGNEINPYNRAFNASMMTGAMRSGTTDLISSATGDNAIAKDLYGIFYNGVDSWLSSMLTSPVLGKLPLDKFGKGKKVVESFLGAAPMGVRASDNAIRDAKIRGASNGQALEMGAATFLAETLSEALTYSNIRGAEEEAVAGTLKEFLKGLPSDGFEEALGEGANEWVEAQADRIIMGARSNYAENVEKYKAEGYPTAVAEQLANQEMIQEVVHSAIVGFVSSGISNTAGYIGGKIFGGRSIEQQQQAEESAAITETDVNTDNEQSSETQSDQGVLEESSAITSENGIAEEDQWWAQALEDDELAEYNDTSYESLDEFEQDYNQTVEDATTTTEETVTEQPLDDGTVTEETVDDGTTPAETTEETVTEQPLDDGTITEEPVDDSGEYTGPLVDTGEEATVQGPDTGYEAGSPMADAEDALAAYSVDEEALAEQDAQALANIEAAEAQEQATTEANVKATASLKNATATPNSSTATVSVAAAVNELGVAPIGNGDSTVTASATSVALAEIAGSPQQAAQVVAGLVNANLQLPSTQQVALGYILSWGALTDGETHQVLTDVIQNGSSGATALNMLNEAFQNDQNNASFADMLATAEKNIKEHRIAGDVKDQIAAGGLDSLQPYQAEVKRQEIKVQNAYAGLQQVQAQIEAAGQNLQTAVNEQMADPGNTGLVAPVQQTAKDLEGLHKVEQEYQQSVNNAEADLQAAQDKLQQATTDALTEMRQTATANVEQQMQAEADAAAAAQQAAADAAAAQAVADAAAAQQQYDDAVAKYQPTKAFDHAVPMELNSGENVDVVGVAYHDPSNPDSAVFVASDGRLLTDNDIYTYGDQQAVTDLLMKWKASDNLAQSPAVWFDHMVEMVDPDTGEAVQLLGITSQADVEDGEVWAVSPDGTQYDIMGMKSGSNPADATYIWDVLDNNKDSIPVVPSLFGQPVPQTTEQTVTAQPTDTTTTTEQTVNEQQQPKAAKPEVKYGEKTGKNNPDPNLQLEPWMNPENHGKVKKPNKAKNNPKSKDFQNWFNDPTPGKLLTDPVTGGPKKFFRGFGNFTSSLLVNHKSSGKRTADGGKVYRNFYSDTFEVAADYAGTDKIIGFRDIVNWETAAAAMNDIGYKLKIEANDAGEMGYQLYNKNGNKVISGIEHGGWWGENELAEFRHTYGGGLPASGIHAGYISCKNPLVIDAGGNSWAQLTVTATAPDGTSIQNEHFTTDAVAEWAFDHGFDTVIVQNVQDTIAGGGPANNTDIITSQPDQFKSIYNNGKFNPKASNILYHKTSGQTMDAQSELQVLTQKDVDNGAKAAYALSEVSNDAENNSGQLAQSSGRVDGLRDRVLADARVGREADGQSTEGGQPVSASVRGGETRLRVLSEASQEKLRSDGVSDLHLHLENDQQQFSNALAEGKASNSHGAYVDNQSIEELTEKGAIMILSADGLAGAAVGTQGKDKGNIFGVFKHQNSTAKGASASLMIHAVAQGGNKLDCYNGGLSRMYEQAGFVPVARVAFNEEFMPDGWNVARDDHPDIVFWMHNGDSAETIAQKFKLDESDGGYHHYTPEEIRQLPLFEDVSENGETAYGYDRAWDYRDQLLADAENNKKSDKSNIQYHKTRTQPNNQTPGQKANAETKVKYSPAKITENLTKALGIGQYGRSGKKFGVKNADGYYNTHDYSISVRNKNQGDYSVTMHEVGHHLAQQFGLQATQEMIENLQKADPEFAKQYSADELGGEAIAEFTWRYLENEDRARAFGGDLFYDTFEYALQHDQKTWDAMQQARTDLQHWLNADANEQITAVVRNRSDAAKPAGKSIVRKILASFVDSTSGAEAFDHAIREIESDLQGKKVKTLDASESLRKSAALNNTAGKRATNILTGTGLTDANWNRIGKSLAERFQDVGMKAKDMDLLNRYMLALHSLDRDVQGKPVFDSHITTEARQAFIADVQANHPTVAAAEQQFQQFRHEFMQAFMVDTGRMTQEALDLMESMYPHYVPTLRVMSTDGITQRVGKNKTYKIQQATGSTQDIYNPMDSFCSMVNSVVQMTSLNNMGLMFDRAYQKYGGLGEFATLVPDDGSSNAANTTNSRTVEQVREMLNGQISDDLMQQVLGTVGSSGFKQANTTSGDTLKVVRPDGTVVQYQFADAELFNLLSGVSEKKVGPMLDMVGNLTRTMSALTTGSNPVFAVRNFMRDFQNSVNWGSWASNYGTGAVRWLKTFAEVWKGDSENFKDYLALGGGGWTRFDPTNKASRAELNADLFEGYYKTSPGRVAQGIKNKIIDIATFERINDVIETTSRYAEYRYGKHDLTTTEGRQDAFLAAQEATVDFGRSGYGALSAQLRKVIPFFNAAMQGSYRTSRIFTEQEQSRAAARITKTIVNTALTSALCSALVLKNSSDDEKEDFANMSSEMKAQHFYLPNFAPDVLGNASLIRVPVAQDPLMYTVHGLVTNAIWNGSSDGLVIQLEDIANAILDTMNPFSNGTIFDPVMDVNKNKTYYGSNIVPTYLQNLSDPTVRYTETTPGVFIDAGRALGVSPMHVQYLAEQYTGFAGQLLIPALSYDSNGNMNGINGALNAITKRFTTDPLVSQQVTSTFYDGANMINNVVTATKQEKPLNQLRRGLSEAEVQRAYEEANAMNSKGGVVYETKKMITASYTEIDQINASTMLTDDEKYEKTSAVRRKMLAAALAANEQIGAWQDKYVTGGNVVLNALMNILQPGSKAHK